jgi:hypothetical protein
MSREHIEQPKKYYTVIGGSFRVQVPKDDPAAIMREWKSADGKSSGVKYERIVSALFGFIQDVSFFDGDYGMQITIKLDFNDKQEQPVIALNAASREGEDFLKKLPSIDLTKEVKLRPYNFTGEGGDEVRAMDIRQPDNLGDFKVKITNFFRDDVKKENINGFPNPDGDVSEYSKDDWKIHFLSARKFLINYTRTNICPKFQDLQHHITTTADAEAVYPEDNDSNVDDPAAGIPW